MSYPIAIATKCITTFLDFLHVVDAVSEHDTSDPSILKTAHVINRLMSFGFSAKEVKELVSNPNDRQALACLKTSELASRYLTLLIQLFKGPKDSNETELQFLERAVINPVADIMRVSSEKSVYEIQHCLKPSLGQQVITPIDDFWKSVLDCKEKIKELENRISWAFTVKVASEFGVVSATGCLYKEFYNNIYARMFSGLGINPRGYNPQEIEEAIMNNYPIPSAFHGDLILSRYICAITLEPIRYPVEDPTTQRLRNDEGDPTLYEKSAIINALTIRPISPITREPLAIDQLIVRTDIQDIIEDRLLYHVSQLSQYLETSPLLQRNLQQGLSHP